MNFIPIDTVNMDEEHLQHMIDLLVKKRVKAIAGYASSLTQLSMYIRNNNLDCSKLCVKSITPGSEAMSSYVKMQLSQQFGCTVNSLYGAEEFGTVGIQLKGSDVYYMDTTGFFYEVLNMERDVPAEDGELGRLVITDLYNYAFPLIRYENGDLVIRKKIKNNTGGVYNLLYTDIWQKIRFAIWNRWETCLSFSDYK